MINIVCLKWGDKYGPEYVNRLYSAVCRNTHKFFKFWCFTEDAKGISRGVNVLPLKYPERLDSWWNKIYLFDGQNGLPLGEQIFYIDLDTLIVANMDHLLTDEVPEIIVLRDFYHGIAKSAGQIGSGLMSWRHGQYTHIWNDFIIDPEKAIAHCHPHGDQAWIEHEITAWYHWQDLFPGDVISFKMHCANGLPPGARIVCYHGKPSIPDSARKKTIDYKWKIDPQPWVLDHWKN
jgi:hypothetical protein